MNSGIHIKKSKRGTFTAAAKKAGMGVQEYAKNDLTMDELYFFCEQILKHK